jgi:hypothetical protein
MSDDTTESPSLFEALRGVAHAYDVVGKKRHGADPNLRSVMSNLDSISVEDALKGADSALMDSAMGEVQNEHGETDPRLDLRETDAGFVAALDIRNTEYKATDVSARESENGVTISTGEWETEFTTEAPVQDIQADHNSDVVTVRVETGEVSEAEPDTTDDTEKDERSQNAAESRELTVAEYLDKHDGVEQKLRKEYGDEMVEMALDMFGDEKMSDALEKLQDMGVDLDL